MTRSVLLSFLVLFIACSEEKRPVGVLDMEQFTEAYTALVENERTEAGWTEINIRKYHPDSALVKVGVTREQMLATMEYYNENPELWQEFYLGAVKQLEQEKGTQPSP